MSDEINPGHYKHGPIECIDYIEGILTPQEFVGYLRGNMVKYQHRLMHKDVPSVNAEKINWYGARLAGVLTRLEAQNEDNQG